MLPDSDIGFMLLASCNFFDNEMQLVRAAVTDISAQRNRQSVLLLFVV